MCVDICVQTHVDVQGQCEIAFTDLSSRLRRIFTSPDEVGTLNCLLNYVCM